MKFHETVAGDVPCRAQAAANAAPYRAAAFDDRTATRRAFVVLVIGGLVGVLGGLPYALALNPPQLAPGSPPLALLVALSLVQSLVLIAAATAVGLWLGPRVGLGAPLVTSWLMGDNDAPHEFRASIVPSIVAGTLAAVVVLVLDVAVFAPRLPRDLGVARAAAVQLWQALLASLYGGITEEILLRLGLMTALVWLGAHVTRAKEPAGWIVWGANALAAVVFALGHLPAAAALVALTPLVVVRTILLNGLAGVIFGWLYWRRGVFAAMVAHFTADLVLQVAAPAILGRA